MQGPGHCKLWSIWEPVAVEQSTSLTGTSSTLVASDGARGNEIAKRCTIPCTGLLLGIVIFALGSAAHTRGHPQWSTQVDKSKQRTGQSRVAESTLIHEQEVPGMTGEFLPVTFTTLTTTTATTTTVTPYHIPGGCLCLYDVDRTLTAKQGNADECHLSWAELHGVYDTAFGGGTLVLSLLAEKAGGPACHECRRGIVSSSHAGGPEMQTILRSKLGVADHFSYASDITSPLVLECGVGVKHHCALGILDWYLKTQNILIKPQDVHLFDDDAENLVGFDVHGMNAHQVSCASRDGSHGRCGGHPDEVQLGRGTTFCRWR